jgi:hypothetical protein
VTSAEIELSALDFIFKSSKQSIPGSARGFLISPRDIIRIFEHLALSRKSVQFDVFLASPFNLLRWLCSDFRGFCFLSIFHDRWTHKAMWDLQYFLSFVNPSPLDAILRFIFRESFNWSMRGRSRSEPLSGYADGWYVR